MLTDTDHFVTVMIRMKPEDAATLKDFAKWASEVLIAEMPCEVVRVGSLPEPE